MKWGDLFTLIRASFDEWLDDKASRLAAALAYYTVFSLAPLLVIAIAIAGRVFGEEAARQRVETEITGLIGSAGAHAVKELLANAHQPAENLIATIIGLVTLLLGASVVFGELQDALNTIWGVAPRPGRGLWGTIKDRFFSFALVLGIGFLLLVSLLASAALSALGIFLQGLKPDFIILMHVLNIIISLAVLTLGFALIFKIVPDVKIAWRDVWIGALLTALLFTLGKLAIGLYLGGSGVTSAFGAAGSLVVILIWVYYSTQIVFLGTEFTKVFAIKYGSQVDLADNAISLAELRAARKFDIRRKVAAIKEKKQ